MSNKKFILGTVVVVITMLMPSPVFALSSDLHYQFSTENQEEFVQKGETNVHFNGAVPDYLLDIYDLTPQQTHNSEFGATIIVPEKASPNATTYAPSSAPSGGYTQSPNGLITGALEGGQTANSGASSSSSSGGSTNSGNSLQPPTHPTTSRIGRIKSSTPLPRLRKSGNPMAVSAC